MTLGFLMGFEPHFSSKREILEFSIDQDKLLDLDFGSLKAMELKKEHS